MYQALYRKYRPRRFEDVCGQEHITTPLRRAVEEGKTSHAYLFSGNRGTGKTTCAKILAKAVNCPNSVNGEPCGECSICKGIDEGNILDISEMDAASNRGIEDARSLRNEVAFVPVVTKYRVYIIDEAHMLTREASNALLKLIEEPPPHVIFIFATTEPQKLPATILSRCMCFQFKRISPEIVAKRLMWIANEENIRLTEEAALFIGRLCDGGMRDAISLLDVCRNSEEEITPLVVSRFAGAAGKEYLFQLTKHIANKDSTALLETLEKVYEDSSDIVRICEELIDHFRNLLIACTVKEPERILKAGEEDIKSYKEQADKLTFPFISYGINALHDTLGKLSYSSSKRLMLELALIRLCDPALMETNEALLARVAILEREVAQLKAMPPMVVESAMAKTNKAPSKKPATEKVDAAKNTTTLEADKVDTNDGTPCPFWNEVLIKLSSYSTMLGTCLAGSNAYICGNHVLIDSSNEIFLNFIRTNDTAKTDLKKVIAEVSGVKYSIGPYSKKDAPAPMTDELKALEETARTLGTDVSINE